MALTPSVLWAQRTETVLLTIDLPDVKEEQFKWEGNTLKFSGKSNSKLYEIDIAFLKPVISEDSKFVVRARQVEILIKKKDKGYWDRLLEKEGRQNWLKVDWNKWKDEDDGDDIGDFGAGGANFNFGGGGDEDDDGPEEKDA